jgi:hypothetical protein
MSMEYGHASGGVHRVERFMRLSGVAAMNERAAVTKSWFDEVPVAERTQLRLI